MLILVTNDDGVRAPGIAVLAAAASRTGNDVLVVAPLEDYSGSGAAVGPVHQREGIAYESYALEGLEGIQVIGIDGPPALAVILACVGAFGPKPDLLLSGINLGANVGRSAMHSGTVGAALTAAHFGLRAMAVSVVYSEGEIHWQTAAHLAIALLPSLAGAPERTVWNLNVPNVKAKELRGLRKGALGRAGTIRSAVQKGQAQPHSGMVAFPPGQVGEIRLELALPGGRHPGDDGTSVGDSDAEALGEGFASLTALVGVREDTTPETIRALEQALDAVHSLLAARAEG
jgi:5'-nucleotidase